MAGRLGLSSSAASVEGSPTKLMVRRRQQQAGGGGNGGSHHGHVRAARPSAVTLDDLSYPPTKAELDAFQPVPLSELPPKYHRKRTERVFVNRPLRLDKIEWIGFDMDYTLAVYQSPAYECLVYDAAVRRLLDIGYPSSIESLRFDPGFPVRGLFLDTVLGNLLKVDRFGAILTVLHGRQRLKHSVMLEQYPTGVVHRDEMGKRFYLLDTLFHVPEACLYADLVHHFEDRGHRERSELFFGDVKMSFANLFQDVRATIDHIHNQGDLKAKTLADLGKYVERSERAPVLLDRFRKAGKKLFLLTNSGYQYSQLIMSYLMEGFLPEYKSWKDFFDVIIVSGRKPLFFDEGTPLRMVNEQTGRLHLSSVSKFERNCIYSGGSLELFRQFTGADGDRVLYVGDHIFSDIIVSKRTQGWRTLLVVRELQPELVCMQTRAYLDQLQKLKNLEFVLAEVFRDLASDATEQPDVGHLEKRIRDASKDLDRQLNCYFGGMFRHGTQRTFFAYQVERYADLYTSDYVNLLNYPLWYLFNPVPATLAHEDALLPLDDSQQSPPQQQQ